MDQSADALPAQCSSLAPYARVTRRIRSTRFPGEWTSRRIRGVRLHMATAEPGRCTGGGCGTLSDRWGRKHLITAGMLTQAAALALIATGTTFTWWLLASALLGAGTAMVYPTLLAAVGDVAHPLWRARAVGVFRLSRDSRYADTPARDSLGSTGGRHRQLA
jgi:Major Facilitator Superfamily